MDWTVVIATVLSAIAYGLVFWWKARQTQDPPPPFDFYKFLSTLVVAVVIGIYFAFTGATFNEVVFLQQMAEWGFWVAIVESILKGLANILGQRWPTSLP